MICQKNFSDFEVIIINDGTKDKSVELIKDIITAYSNVHLINQENKGLSEARNVGIKFAKGEYISFIDSDDWIEENMISAMYNTATHTNSDIAICNIRKVYETNPYLLQYMKHGITTNSTLSSKEAIDLFFDHKKITGHACNKIYKVELFREHDITFPRDKSFEDLPTTFELLWYAKKVVFLEESFYNYLQRDGSITQNLHKNLWHLIENVYLIKKFLIDIQEYKSYEKKFSSLLISSLFAVYLHLQKFKRDKNYVNIKMKLNGELRKINDEYKFFSKNLFLLKQLKYLIMVSKCDYIIDLLLTAKAYKNKLKLF